MNNEIFEQLNILAFKRSIPFCYGCYKEAPTGCCKVCGSDDLMRLVPGVGCEYGTDWVIKHILETELTAVDLEEEFEKSIRQCYPEETQVGWMTFDTVKLMKENDPVGWRGAFADYESQVNDDEAFITIDGFKHYSRQDVENLLI